MKRVKVLFTAFAVLAVVSGALAFKAQRFGHGTLYCSTTNGGTCSASKDFDETGSLTRYCTTVADGTCNITFTDIADGKN